MSRLPFVPVLLALAMSCARAADDAATPPSAHQLLRERLAEESAPGAAKATPAPAPGAPITETAKAMAEAAAEKKAGPAPQPSPGADTKAEAQKQPANVLPKVEVNKQRITKLDVDLAKQDREIAREKKNTKISETDKALNDVKIAKPLAIFGGESAQVRKQTSNQRIALMEDEKDILEAMAHAQTKEEKALLKEQLDVIRAERRELERLNR